MKVACLVVALLCIAPCRADVESAQKSTPESVPEIAPINAEDSLAQTRFSLSMRDAPLLQIAKLLELSTPARFRWGAPPDVVLSPNINDGLLLPSLNKMLKNEQWQAQRDGADVFLLPVGGRAKTWALWTGGAKQPRKATPPRDWMQPPVKEQVRLGLAEGTTITKNAAPASMWIPLPISTVAQKRPGLVARLPQDIVYLRWQIDLRFVPARARLLLDVPAATTLYANGAPVGRNLRGLCMIDLSRVLQRGDNVLALQTFVPAASAALRLDQVAPTLAYEWFFESEPGGAASVQNRDEGG